MARRPYPKVRRIDVSDLKYALDKGREDFLTMPSSQKLYRHEPRKVLCQEGTRDELIALDTIRISRKSLPEVLASIEKGENERQNDQRQRRTAGRES